MSSRYCPLKAVVTPGMENRCEGYRCAWFDEFGGECAIQSIASLEELSRKAFNISQR